MTSATTNKELLLEAIVARDALIARIRNGEEELIEQMRH
jgi:hypothetical protein